MTPAQILTLVRDIAILVGVGLILWMVYHAGQNQVHVSDLKGLENEIKAQQVIVDGWRSESAQAQLQLTRDLALLANAPPVKHVWVCQQPAKPAVLPSPAGKADSSTTEGRGIQPSDGTVSEGFRRDAIVSEFKKQWESQFALCRSVLNQWP